MNQINRSKMTGRFNLRKQAGDFMVSLSVALIIVAIISAGIYIAFAENARKNEVTVSINAITATAANLRKNFGINNTYGAVTTGIAIQSRTIPAEQRNGALLTASNSYSGAITTVPATLITANDVVDLSYARVPSSQCVDIVLGTEAVARKIMVGAAIPKATDTPLVLATLTAACESATNVTIVWSVGRTGT